MMGANLSLRDRPCTALPCVSAAACEGFLGSREKLSQLPTLAWSGEEDKGFQTLQERGGREQADQPSPQ